MYIRLQLLIHVICCDFLVVSGARDWASWACARLNLLPPPASPCQSRPQRHQMSRMCTPTCWRKEVLSRSSWEGWDMEGEAEGTVTSEVEPPQTPPTPNGSPQTITRCVHLLTLPSTTQKKNNSGGGTLWVKTEVVMDRGEANLSLSDSNLL